MLKSLEEYFLTERQFDAEVARLKRLSQRGGVVYMADSTTLPDPQKP